MFGARFNLFGKGAQTSWLREVRAAAPIGLAPDGRVGSYPPPSSAGREAPAPETKTVQSVGPPKVEPAPDLGVASLGLSKTALFPTRPR